MAFAYRVPFAVVCIGWVAAAAAAQPKHGDFGSETVQVGDVSREYRLVVPKTVDLSKPAPLVAAFHGMLIDSKDRC